MKNFCLVELLRNFNFARASVENAVLQASGWQNGRPLVKLMEFRKRSIDAPPGVTCTKKP